MEHEVIRPDLESKYYYNFTFEELKEALRLYAANHDNVDMHEHDFSNMELKIISHKSDHYVDDDDRFIICIVEQKHDINFDD